MSAHDMELFALAEELMHIRQLSRAEAMFEARRALEELEREALAWDYEVEQTRAELRQYAQVWDSASGELRSQARRTRRRRRAA